MFPFSLTNKAIRQLLGLLYAQQISVSALSLLFRPYFYAKGVAQTKNPMYNPERASKRLAMNVFSAIVDTVNLMFWVGLILLILDVILNRIAAFAWLDQNKFWAASALAVFLVWRLIKRVM